MAIVPRSALIKEQEARARKLEDGHKSLVLLRKNFFPSTKEEVDSAWFHYEIDDILLNRTESFLIMGFRDCGKTQFTKALIYHCVRYPRKNRRYILIVMADKELASNKLKECTDKILNTPALSSAIMRDEKGRPMIKQNSEGAFQAVVKDYETGEPIEIRIAAYGKGSNIRGAEWDSERPDIVFMDDIQNRADFKNEDSKIPGDDWDWFQGEIRMLGKSTRFVMIGNNLGAKCIMARAIVEANEGRLNAKTMIIPIKGQATLDGKKVGEADAANWPAKFPIEFVNKEMADYVNEMHIFYRERMCENRDPDSQEFKDEYFKFFYDPAVLNFAKMLTYITMDLGAGKKKHSNQTAITVNSVNSSNIWFIREIVHGRWGPKEKVKKLFEVVSRYIDRSQEYLVLVAIEQGALKNELDEYLSDEMHATGIYFRVEELKNSEGKARIGLLSPKMAKGGVQFPKNMPPWFVKLKAELLAYPDAKEDDLSDTLAYQFQVAKGPAGDKDSDKKTGKKRKVAGVW